MRQFRAVEKPLNQSPNPTRFVDPAYDDPCINRFGEQDDEQDIGDMEGHSTATLYLLLDLYEHKGNRQADALHHNRYLPKAWASKRGSEQDLDDAIEDATVHNLVKVFYKNISMRMERWMITFLFCMIKGDSRIMVQEVISSGPTSFVQSCNVNASFVDKTLAIEAFLRDGGGHHLILRPRRCGKSYTLDMIREFLQRPLRLESHHSRDITTSRFESTAITDQRHSDLVSRHFQQHPVLYIDLKDVRGITFNDMLESFDAFITWLLDDLSHPLRGVPNQDFRRFCEKLCDPRALQKRRSKALQAISQELQTVFGKPVVVLIDEYDSPMHSAIEHGYAAQASEFFATVFGSLLKSNNAVWASMMVGICNVAKSGWLSQLNHLEIFPMHAEDDRYAKFFLFTEDEVEILCEAHNRELPRYNGYAARYNDGLVKLYNPLSVVGAMEKKKTSNF